MSSSAPLKPPNDAKAFVFAWLYGRYDQLLSAMMPAPLRTRLFQVFGSISPAVPVTLEQGFRDPDKRAAVIQSFLIAFFFCFVVNLGLTYSYGTLLPSGPQGEVERMNFLDDRHNIILYAIVVPLYVAGAVYIIITTIEGWSALRGYATTISNGRLASINKYRPTFVFFAMLGICTLFIINYTVDILDKENVRQIYWFMTETSSGDRVLNPIGAYYVVMNFVLLFITIGAIVCFYSLFFEVLRIGHALNDVDADQVVEFEDFRNALGAFTEAYLAAKILVAVYIVNFYVWWASPLGETSNLFATLLALSIIGLFFVSYPRYFVELQWHYYKQRIGHARGTGDDAAARELPLDDIRPLGVRVTAHILDTIFIGGFLIGTWVTYFELRL